MINSTSHGPFSPFFTLSVQYFYNPLQWKVPSPRLRAGSSSFLLGIGRLLLIPSHNVKWTVNISSRLHANFFPSELPAIFIFHPPTPFTICTSAYSVNQASKYAGAFPFNFYYLWFASFLCHWTISTTYLLWTLPPIFYHLFLGFSIQFSK